MTRPSARGFSLFELLLTFIVIGVMAGNATVFVDALRGTLDQRARADLKLIAEGIWGGRPYENGFVADVGRVPADLSGELTFVTGFAPGAAAVGALHGWQGPYAGYDVARLALDPWDRPWRLLPDGRVASDGPDAITDTADDLVAPEQPPAPNGLASQLGIAVLDERGRQLGSASVLVLVSKSLVDGVQPAGTLQRVGAADAGGDGRFLVTNLSPGRHAVEVDGLAGGPYAGARGVAMAWTPPGGSGSATVRIRF